MPARMDQSEEAELSRLLETQMKYEAEREALALRLRELDRKIVNTQAEHRAVRNRYVPLSMLPTEVTGLIFQKVLEYSIQRSSEEGRRVLVEIIVSHVCHQWRSISLAFPPLWAIFRHRGRSSSTSHLSLDQLDAYLERPALPSLSSTTSPHDSSFLNIYNTVTDVLYLNRFKLRRYRSNIEKFVQQVPKARSYTLEAQEDYKFKRPKPLRATPSLEVEFQYPTQAVQQLHDITLQVTLSFRVAVLGPNGSGKSTLVKLLIGDMEPNKGGEAWKRLNLVIGGS
ncbi:hypothetical protein GALMADRAFT_207391 [Galerina marginata CBS 339.88]|uniref:ABC transporter domain-containing protein n=1 Tax=Galerina marginata (strain CBS 339.88) TaxID=685588 RepID=A0A067TI90_GALM3|nr:hypothetical protein GALMADRAFT_207391 [Galerina marginata CBS 339.88]